MDPPPPVTRTGEFSPEAMGESTLGMLEGGCSSDTITPTGLF